MTLQELSKYYDIQMTLEKDREALERLRQRITPASPQLTGMPHTPGVRDKVGDLAVELADMDERIRWLEELAAQEKPKVEAYCKSMDCHQRRQKLYQVEPHARPGRNAVCVLPGVLCWAERQAH